MVVRYARFGPSIDRRAHTGASCQPMPRAQPRKDKAQRFLARPLKVLVGRVGIEPTTNGSRVQGTAVRAEASQIASVGRE